MSRDYITKLKILSVFAVVSGVIYIVFKYMLPVVAPFIIASVSYTHLDVYKRQIQGLPVRHVPIQALYL